MSCSFRNQATIGHKGAGSAEFLCEERGTKYFSCPEGDHCTVGQLKLQIHVTDALRTLSLR